MRKALIFDWGGTVMTDTGEPGPMYLWKEVGLVAGIGDAIRNMPGYVMCIATNAGISDTAAMRKALARVGAETWFQHFFSSKDLGHAKPDTRFFLQICSEIGVVPSECVMIGNDYEKDIRGAKDAGLATVFYNPGNIPGPFPEADAVITNMYHLPTILNSWSS